MIWRKRSRRPLKVIRGKWCRHGKWWRHDVDTFLRYSSVKRPVIMSFDIFIFVNASKLFGSEALIRLLQYHYNDVIMSAMASQITSLTIVYSTVYSGADQRKHQTSASLALVRGFHRWPLNSPHNGPVTRKCFHLMTLSCCYKDLVTLNVEISAAEAAV